LGISQGGIAIATVEYDDSLYVFVQASDGHLWMRQWDGSSCRQWADQGTPPGRTGWTSLGGVITSAPTVGQNAGGRLEAFARGTDAALWHNWQDTIGGWSGWDSLGGTVVPP
jgi:hypothetical protein